LDGRLPGVWVALVLLSTSLASILLAEQEEEEEDIIDNDGASTDPEEVVTSSHGTISASRSRAGTGFVEEVLETLRLLDSFLPRINMGKVKVAGPSSDVRSSDATGCRETDATGFPYLKRDLVRLLGILCHNSKVIQDRIRSCGGIPVILNLCVIDDRNPCKFLFWSCVPRCCGRTDAGKWRGRDRARFLSHTHIHTHTKALRAPLYINFRRADKMKI